MARQTVFDRCTTPEALENFIKGVKLGRYTSLFIVGRGGTGKSTLVRRHFPINDEDNPPDEKLKGAFWKNSRISPVKVYEHLWRFRDRNIVLDDVPNLGKERELTGLLKSACETEDQRHISWDTQNKDLEKMGIPPRFVTSSRLLLIANRWMDRHEEVESLETRLPILLYNPTAEVIHALALSAARKAREDACGLLFEPEIVEYVEGALKEGRVHTLNLRDYIMAGRRFRNGDDWKAVLEQKFLPDEIEDTPSDVDYIRMWMSRQHIDRFTVGQLQRSTRRFRGENRASLGRTLAWMVDRGLLIKVETRRICGPGHPPSDEYASPSLRISRPTSAAGRRGKLVPAI